MIKGKIAELIHLFGSSGGDSPSTETILWENNNPNNNFSNRSIYLSESAISNYKYLKFIFANTKTALNTLITVLYQPQDMEPMSRLNLDYYGEPCVTTRARNNGTVTYTRKFWYAEDPGSSDPSRKYYVYFYDSVLSIGTGSGFVNDSLVIPLKIIGIK